LGPAEANRAIPGLSPGFGDCGKPVAVEQHIAAQLAELWPTILPTLANWQSTGTAVIVVAILVKLKVSDGTTLTKSTRNTSAWPPLTSPSGTSHVHCLGLRNFLMDGYLPRNLGR
jgi:hypothetical protein